MSILPRAKAAGADPPVIEWLRGSRLYARIQRHRILASAVAAVLVVLRLWKWTVAAVLEHHWTLAAVVAGGVFVVAFALSRLGLDWLDRRVEPEVGGTFAAGPSWAERPPERVRPNVPQRMG